MSDKPTIREKFKIKPFEWWEIYPYCRGGIKCWRGTYKTFGFECAITQFSPLVNFLLQAVRGFPYRHYSLAVNESAFTFNDGKGCSSVPQVIDGGRDSIAPAQPKEG